MTTIRNYINAFQTYIYNYFDNIYTKYFAKNVPKITHNDELNLLEKDGKQKFYFKG